jgi:hypothetical protein
VNTNSSIPTQTRVFINPSSVDYFDIELHISKADCLSQCIFYGWLIVFTKEATRHEPFSQSTAFTFEIQTQEDIEMMDTFLGNLDIAVTLTSYRRRDHL